MKILHTADWHLGKILNGVSLIDDQKYIIRQIIEIVKQEEVDALIIAGDLYDRAIPAVEAIALLNDALYDLNVSLKIPIFAVSGNHDSPERLAFGSAWYEANNFYLASKLTGNIVPIHWENLQIWLLPYHDMYMVQALFPNKNIQNFDDAMAALMAEIKQQQDPNKHQICVAHAFVAGGTPSDSERSLSVGNVDRVSLPLFDHFDYVALGHLHRPHALKSEHIHYSGSPLQYSFSEANEQKSVKIITFDTFGSMNVKEIGLNPLRPLSVVEGYLDDLLQKEGDILEHYVKVRLLDEGALIEPMAKLKQHFPYILELERIKKRLPQQQQKEFQEIIRQDATSLFQQFFQYTTGNELTRTQLNLVSTAVENSKRGENK